MAEVNMDSQDMIAYTASETDQLVLQNFDDENSKDCINETANDAMDSKKNNLINGDDNEIGRFLQEGIEFESYAAFQSTLQQYSDATFANFAHLDSSMVEKLANAKEYNKDIIYNHVVLACIYGGKKIPSKSSGIRNCSSRKIGCPVKLRLGVTPDKQRLVIKDSRLDCHNHDLSEENYRLKNLDEETELEIYNLISMHENKRVARQLVRDKLAKETGKNIHVKDISNIEKRVSKKMEKQLEIEKKEEALPEADDEPSNMTEDFSEEEVEEEKEHEEKEHEEKEQEEKDQEEKEQEETDEHTSAQSNKSPSITKSPTRPKRHIREPRRFRDTDDSKKVSGSESTPSVTSKLKSFLTKKDEEAISKTRTPQVSLSRIEMTPETTDLASDQSETSSAKMERRGRKRKVPPEEVIARPTKTASTSKPAITPKSTEITSKPASPSKTAVQLETFTEVSSSGSPPVEPDKKFEIRERKLAIQEELLVLEKKKIEMLQDMAKKLDKILENQGKV